MFSINWLQYNHRWYKRRLVCNQQKRFTDEYILVIKKYVPEKYFIFACSWWWPFYSDADFAHPSPFDKVVFAEILLTPCIISPSPAKASPCSSVFDAVHLNLERFKWLIFVNKRTLLRLPNYGCHYTSMHQIISTKMCFRNVFKNKKLNGSFSVCLSTYNCIHHVNTSGKFNK